MDTITFAGETIRCDDIRHVETITPAEEAFETMRTPSMDGIRRFHPGPEITTTVTLKSGRVLTETVPNPNYKPTMY